MDLQRLLRGTVEWERLEAVVRELAARYGDGAARAEFLDADNWLSTPFILHAGGEAYFVKVVSRQNSTVHALFTAGRNLGAFTSGTEGFFGHFGTPADMARHELEATREMRAIGVNTPEPVEALEVDGLGVLVVEYLPAFRPLDELDTETERELAPALFGALRRLHDNGLAHGDLRAENVLILDDELYLIDATSVREPGALDARDYDLACGLAALEPLIGAPATVEAALSAYPPAALLDAREYLDFVAIRPDHDFDGPGLKGEIEKCAVERGEAERSEAPS